MKGHFNHSRDFGVEIEFLIPRDKTKQDIANALVGVGIDTRVESYNHTTRNWWKIVNDVSVQSTRTHFGNNELVSPRLRGQQGLDELEKVCNILNMMDCEVNKSCGLHVHQDVTEIVEESDANAKRFIKNLVGFVAKYEHIIYKLIPPSRLDNRRYSVPCRRLYFQGVTDSSSRVTSYMKEKIKQGVRLKRNDTGMGELQRGRTCGLNLYKIWDRGSVEFRYHNGTLNFDKMKSWIVTTNAIINSVDETNFVKLCYVPSGSRGLASFRGAIGFVGRSGNQDGTPYTNDELTRDANLFIQRRYREFNSPSMESRYSRNADYSYVSDGTFRGEFEQYNRNNNQ